MGATFAFSSRSSDISPVFADNLIPFRRADEKGVDFLNNIIFLAMFMMRLQQTYVVSKLGSNRVADLGKYLDMPFFHNSVGANTF